MQQEDKPNSNLIPNPAPQWSRPRTPLAPARLAALANALGVSTPTPATHPVQSPSLGGTGRPSSATNSTFSDTPWRSSSPSFSSSSYVPTTSKFMLHVIPPMSLPHDTDSSGPSEYTPAPATASGYHNQFKRGTLLPMHSTLQSQLGAIAKEYALPSTAGMVLYLVTTTQVTPSTSSLRLDDALEEPGPRLSPEIWHHLWTRVLRTEEPTLPRSPTPHLFGLGLNASAGQGQTPTSLRSLITPQPTKTAYPVTPSPSTPSSIRSHTKSAPPSSSSGHSDPDTPNTSSSSQYPPDASNRADSLDLPGLRSPSLIPILAKVEFDIDRRKATWLEPWLRSRKTNLAKRAESRNGMRERTMSSASSSIDDGSSDDKEPRGRTIDLRLVERMQTASPVPSFAFSVAQDSLVEEPDGMDGYAPLEDEGLNESPNSGQDPLGEVFGTDEDTWAEMASSNRDSKRAPNLNVVPLALDGAALAQPIEDDGDETMMEEKEVRDILDKMNRPSLVVSIPSSPPDLSKRRSSPTTVTGRKHLPPPLVLQTGADLSVPPVPSPGPMSAESIGLPYLRGSPSSSGTAIQPTHGDKPFEDIEPMHDENEDGGSSLGSSKKYKSPQEERRAGGVFDDLDLGLDEDEDPEFDSEDPEDRRQSQFLMRAKLDEIERTLAQFSPRPFTATEEEGALPGRFVNAQHGSPLSGGSASRNTDVFPPTPGLAPQPGASWPAVPYSTLSSHEDSPSSLQGMSPPTLAVNGVSTSAPKAYFRRDSAASTSQSQSQESELRRKRQEEEDAQYPELLPPSFSRRSGNMDSPVIPMSPDPFGRFASTQNTNEGRTSSYWDQDNTTAPDSTRPSVSSERSHVTSSRFSADSVASLTGAESKAPLISVKSIKKLWRKSNKASIGLASGPPPPTPTLERNSFMDQQDAAMPRSNQPSPAPGQQPRSLQPNNAPPQPQSRPFTPASAPPKKTVIQQLHFDQQSPYPSFTHIPSPQPQVMSLPSGPSNGPISPTLTALLPAPDKKERNSVRKSILKWKSSNNLQKDSGSDANRSRRPSIISFSGRGSTSSDMPPPPSPQIPDHFTVPPKMTPSSSVDSQHSSRLNATTPPQLSVLSSPPTSPPSTSKTYARSVASSKGSHEGGRESLGDDSQFEMISPMKGGGRASYPYHGLNGES